MYLSILYKTKGTQIYSSRFCCYKKNILTLKETFVLQIFDEFFTIIFVFLVEDSRNYEVYSLLYIIYCNILYFIGPILLLISLRKTLPEFYVDNLNIQQSMEKAGFYEICKTRSINLEPRTPEITMKKLLENNAKSKIPPINFIENNSNSQFPVLLVTSPSPKREVSKQLSKMPEIV